MIIVNLAGPIRSNDLIINVFRVVGPERCHDIFVGVGGAKQHIHIFVTHMWHAVFKQLVDPLEDWIDRNVEV
jgi:hypothetical protein